MSRIALSSSEVQEHLRDLPGWQLRDGALERELKFESFSQAFAFMTQAAFVSERLNHHPDWSNTYNRVLIRLMTHDIGSVTMMDIRWASDVNKLLAQGAPTKSGAFKSQAALER